MFSEFYSTLKKVLENMFNNFHNSISQEIDLYVLQCLYSYFDSFALFLYCLHDLIEKLINNPTSKKLDNTIGQWNTNIEECRIDAAACLESLANIKVEQKKLSANIIMLRLKTKEVIAHLQNDLGSNITLKLPKKGERH